MTSAEMIPAVILKKKAVVYVRQSTQSQVMTNLEGNYPPPFSAHGSGRCG